MNERVRAHLGDTFADTTYMAVSRSVVAALAAVVAAATVVLAAPARGDPAATSSIPTQAWEIGIGRVAFSSPVVAEIDGVRAIVVGTLSGYVHVVNAATGHELPGWPRPVEIIPGQLSAVDSSPAVAYLDGPNREPSIIVGAGSLYVHNQQGGVEAFYWNGVSRFRFRTRVMFNEWGTGPNIYSDSVFATPAVGDITGNGQQDIVFGSYDHFIYALTPSGHIVPGFPYDNKDTIWSSPGLYDVTGTGKDDIYTGADSTGLDGCWGGWVYDFRYRNGAPRVIWKRCEGQAFWSSPAIGAINNSGRAAVVIGTSWDLAYTSHNVSNRIYAFYADTGANVPGWPVTTTGSTFGSPAIGDLTGAGGGPDVVASSCAHCSTGPAVVSAFSGSGHQLWSRTIGSHDLLSSPVLVDLTGSGGNDVVVGDVTGLYALDGRTGNFLDGTGSYTIGHFCDVMNSAAVVYLPYNGWRLVEACGGPLGKGRLIAYRLPTAPRVPPAWMEFRGDGTRDGQEADPSWAHETACPSTSSSGGYRMVSAAGSVISFRAGPSCGSLVGEPMNSAVTAMTTDPRGNGYWLATADGAVYAFGAARLYPGDQGLPAIGSMAGQPLPGKIVAIAASPDGRGYLLAGADGSVYAFGDAKFHGSMTGVPLNKPVVGMTIDPATGGYWLVASDGGIFTFDTKFFGSTGGIHLKKPIVGMAADPLTGGYWLVASDGGIFAFNAHFYGSTGRFRLTKPIVAMASDRATGGYWMVGSDGGVFAFHAPFNGALRPGQVHTPIAAISPVN